MKGALVVCARLPLPDDVRTSLHTHLTERQSSDLRCRFLIDTCQTTLNVEGVDFFLAHAPNGRKGDFEGLLPASFALLPQTASGRGPRLADVFERLLTQRYEWVLALNSTSPDLPICLINQAADVLSTGRAEMVCGPSERDGFYLLGLRRYHRELFENVNWEMPQFGSKVLREARKLDLKLRRLPEWYELNTVEDLRRHLTYYALRRRSADADWQCRTGEYLFQIQDRIVPQVCRID